MSAFGSLDVILDRDVCVVCVYVCSVSDRDRPRESDRPHGCMHTRARTYMVLGLGVKI
jgi:hypothetical protein